MSPDRPSPEPDPVSAPFFAALSEGWLCIQTCRACAAAQLGELACNRCGSRDLAWVPASGKGTVHAATRLHLAYGAAFSESVPYNAVTVELAEGPRLPANIVNDDETEADVRIGMPVEVRYSKLSTGVTVPVFAPAA